ncbi:MAG: serine/threonine-protein kinase [bacterium]
MALARVSVDHLVGSTLGTCRIIKELGRGSMGIVCLGYQTTLKRPVAVKVLPKALVVDPVAGARFRQEAETAAILTHPHIIPIYEVGETEELYFMVMQLVKGMALSQILERARKHPVPSKRLIPMGEGIRILLQVLDALSYAHEEEVIHRDIKPANILLEAKTSRVLLSDFGIAKELRGEDLDQGRALGTPLYMAPEQAMSQEVDGRADIYAVGVILFEMAVGTLPIYPEPVGKLRQRKVSEPLGMFSKMPSQCHPRVDKELEAIILKAISLRPDDRFCDCKEFANALKEYSSKRLHAMEQRAQQK